MKKTNRGFLTSSRKITSCHQLPATVKVTQSSSLSSHEHIWIFIDGEDCAGSAHLSLKAATSLRDQLTELIEALR